MYTLLKEGSIHFHKYGKMFITIQGNTDPDPVKSYLTSAGINILLVGPVTMYHGKCYRDFLKDKNRIACDPGIQGYLYTERKHNQCFKELLMFP